MSRLVVAMFGVSGVGKGWLGRRLREHRPEVLHLKASELMREALGQSSEALRTAPADRMGDNQTRLIAAFMAALSKEPARPVLFDGHSVIDNDVALVEIPLNVIAELTPSAIAFVSDDVEAILHRRRMDSRSRPQRTPEELTHHGKRARAVALSYAERLAIPFADIGAGDWQALSHLFDGCS